MTKETKPLESKLKKILEGIDYFYDVQEKLRLSGNAHKKIFTSNELICKFVGKDYIVVQMQKPCNRIVYEGLIKKGEAGVYFYLPQDKLPQLDCCGKHKKLKFLD